ncbi:MAG: VWD domain-containing protein, partial [Catenulispora sp.]|nr:VWD domain-containing protein [Catenulispora sp.]
GLVVGAALLGITAPAPALAAIDYGGDTGLQAGAAACMAEFRTNDPAHIMPTLNDPAHHILMVRDRADPPFHNTTPWGHGQGDPVVTWAPGEHGKYMDGIEKEDCSGLYHELTHAYDYTTNTDDPGECGTGPNNAPVDEVRATRAENLFRLGHHPPLHMRISWSGKDIPPGIDAKLMQVEKDCRGWAGPPKKQALSCPVNGSRASQTGHAGQAGQTALADPSPSGCGASNGDPHLTTFDGRRYDFQAVGEFELVKADGVEVQARQSAFPDSRRLSVNSALALRVGADRLLFDLGDGDGLRIRLNGADTVVTAEPLRLPGGGTVAWDDDGLQYVVDWPNGTVAAIEVIGDWGMRIAVYPPAALRDRTQGLLGDFDGDPDTELVYKDGGILPEHPSRHELYGTFADGWRLTDATSLLPYPPGTKTSTFTDRFFPEKLMTVADLDPAQAAAARQLCQAFRITDRVALDDCTLDVAVTGQPAFAVSAVATDRQAGPEHRPAVGGIAPGGTIHDGSVVAGDIAAPGQVDVYHLAVGTATVLRLADETGDVGTSGRSTLTITADGHPDGSTAPGFWYTTPDHQFRLAPGGTYTLKVSRTDGDTGPYRFVAATAKEHRIPITLGTSGQTGTSVSGDLESRGRVDIYTFEAPEDGWIQAVGGAPKTFSMGVDEDSEQPTVYTSYPLDTDQGMSRVKRGQTYDLIVWSERQETGAYSLTPQLTQTP